MKKIILVFLVIVLFFLYGCTDKDTMQPDADYTTEVTYYYEIKKFNEDKRKKNEHNMEKALAKDYTGYWAHTVYPEDYYVIIYEQQGAAISFWATAYKLDGIQSVNVRQENVYIDSDTASFGFIDSFSNKGIGSLKLSDDTITLMFFASGSRYGDYCIDAGNGSYKKIKELSEIDGFNKKDYTVINPDDILKESNNHYTNDSHSNFMGVWYYTQSSDPQFAYKFLKIKVIPYGKNKAKVLWADGKSDVFEFTSETEGIGTFGSISKAKYYIDKEEGAEHFNVTVATGGEIFQPGVGGYRVIPDYYKK